MSSDPAPLLFSVSTMAAAMGAGCCSSCAGGWRCWESTIVADLVAAAFGAADAADKVLTNSTPFSSDGFTGCWGRSGKKYLF